MIAINCGGSMVIVRLQRTLMLLDLRRRFFDYFHVDDVVTAVDAIRLVPADWAATA
jgi:hypothetical protein